MAPVCHLDGRVQERETPVGDLRKPDGARHGPGRRAPPPPARLRAAVHIRGRRVPRPTSRHAAVVAETPSHAFYSSAEGRRPTGGRNPYRSRPLRTPVARRRRLPWPFGRLSPGGRRCERATSRPPRGRSARRPCRRLRVPSQPSRSFGFDFNRPRCLRCDIWVVSGWQSERTGECAPRASADGEGTLSGLGGTAGRARSPGSQKRGRAAWANAERRPLCLPWMTSVGPGATPEPCGPRGHRRAAAPRIPLNRDSNTKNGGS